MLTIDARVHVNEEGIIHEGDISMGFQDTWFWMSQGEADADRREISVESEVQAQSLILAIRAMCAAIGWKA